MLCYRSRPVVTALLVALLAGLQSIVRSRLELEARILALRHQLAVLQRQAPSRPRLRRTDRLVWMLLSRLWPNLRRAVQIVTPDTVVRWHRRGFALYWWWKSRPRRAGRPSVSADIRALIRQMHAANPLWGPRGSTASCRSSDSRSHRRRWQSISGGVTPSLTWRTFLTTHGSQLASIDFFTVPTATFRVLFVFLVLSHDRAAHYPRERHGPPDGGVDRSATPRSVAVGHRAAIRHTGP
jgi:hypothetical protein